MRPKWLLTSINIFTIVKSQSQPLCFFMAIDTLSKKLLKRMDQNILCIGLDSDYDKLPQLVKKNNSIEDAIFSFNKALVDATNEFAVAYKQNVVFYSGFGIEGLKALKKTNEYVKDKYPGIALIADCKRSEMLRSGQLAAKEIFEEFLFDSLTVTPWFGYDTVAPYVKYADKGVFVLCHDSNPTASEIQQLKLKNGRYLYEEVTQILRDKWNKTGNVFAEAGLTYPKELKRVREIAGEDMIILSPGLGAQGGEIEDVKFGMNKKGNNLIVAVSRSIIFASEEDNFAEKARETTSKLHNDLNSIRKGIN